MAQDKTIIITESDLPYTNQTWFYSGNMGLQEDEIKKNWDKGKRITSAAYTSNGWFVTMSNDSNIGAQTYKLSTSIPTDWIKGKWNEDYYITSITYSGTQWLVIMSKHKSFHAQSYNCDTWENLRKWIREKWKDSYVITEATYNGTNWMIVMSKSDYIDTQKYSWAHSDVNVKIKEEGWDKDYNLQLLNYGDGEYFIVFCKYNKVNGRAQGFSFKENDISDWIKKKWNNTPKQHIAYIGGGYKKRQASTNKNSTQNQNKKSNRQNLPGGGYIEYTYLDNGGLLMQTVMPCISCRGSKVCTSCYGQRGRWGPAFGGTWYPCNLCGGTGQNHCIVCAGKGEIITTVYTEGDESYGFSSNGTTSKSNSAGTIVQTPYGTKVYPNGETNSSSTSTSSPKANSSRTTCTKCGGRRYETTSYSSAAASTHGWMQPYHNSIGSSCPYCNSSTDHYHYPCTECRGYGHN